MTPGERARAVIEATWPYMKPPISLNGLYGEIEEAIRAAAAEARREAIRGVVFALDADVAQCDCRHDPSLCPTCEERRRVLDDIRALAQEPRSGRVGE